MSIYARVENGRLAEIILPYLYEVESPDWQEGDTSRIGEEAPIGERFTPDFVATLVDITGVVPQPQEGWAFDGEAKTFSPYVPPAPTPEQVLATNTAERDRLLSIATLAIAPLQDAVDLDDATASETALLKTWKQYRVAVNRIDLTTASPPWPAQPA